MNYKKRKVSCYCDSHDCNGRPRSYKTARRHEEEDIKQFLDLDEWDHIEESSSDEYSDDKSTDDADEDVDDCDLSNEFSF